MSGKEKLGKEVGLARVACPTSSYSLTVQAVRALYVIKKAKYKDLSTSVGVHPANVSKALSTAADIGFASSVKGERGVYTLTDAGKNFAQALDISREDEAREILRATIMQNPRWATIVEMLKAAYGRPVRPLDIAADVERKLGKTWTPNARSDIASNIKTILEEAGIATLEGDGLVFTQSEKFLGNKNVDAELPQIGDLVSRPSYPKDTGDYEELVTSHYQIRVRMDENSIEKLARQLKQGSIVSQWLEDCLTEVANTEKPADDDEEDR